MSKLKNKKKVKSHLTPEERKMGKTDIYILIGMIVIGVAIAFYNLQ